MRPTSRDDFKIAVICALRLEADAIEALFDETYDRLGKYYGKEPGDRNLYINGRIGKHNVVLCYMSEMGKNNAARVASNLRLSYTRIQLALDVGICGGAPFLPNNRQIFLGDVIISDTMVEYNFGRQYPRGFQQDSAVKDTLGRPDQGIRSLLTSLKGSRTESEFQSQMLQHLHILQQSEAKWQHPGIDDILFDASHHHKHHMQTTTTRCLCFEDNWPIAVCRDASEETCDSLGCDKNQITRCRPHAEATLASVNIGKIASADTVLKSGVHRDHLMNSDHVIGFITDGAALWDIFPCIIVTGVCEYADGHRNKVWQHYAAATAASATKAFLEYWISGLEKESHSKLMVPRDRNPRFVGREDEVTTIERLIMQKGGPDKIAICGLAAIGKTEIALELAYRMRDRDPECSIFWIPCTGYSHDNDSVEQAYMSIAQIAGLPTVKSTEIKDLVKNYLSQKSSGKWLLIFDNVDTDMWVQDSNNSSPALKNHLPQSDQCHILFTTRNRMIADTLAGPYVISISGMDVDTGIRCLQQSLVQKDLLKDHDAAVSLLQLLNFMPLAITQAAAYINRSNIGLAQYLALLQEQESVITGLKSDGFSNECHYSDIQNPFLTTLIHSFQLIQRSNKLAADYLSFMACISPDNIPQSLLPDPVSRKRGLDAIGLLKAHSLIDEQVEDRDHLFNIHQLVHRAARNWLRMNRQFSLQILRTADRFDEVFFDDNNSNGQVWRRYLPHAISLIGESEFQKQQEKYDQLLLKIGKCLLRDGKYNEASVLFNTVIGIQQRKYGDTSPLTLTTMGLLAHTYQYQGMLKEAEDLEVQVLKTREQKLGTQHPDTLTSMSNLATIYIHQGRLKDAEDLEIQVLDISKMVLGSEHPKTLTSMSNLVSIYIHQGRWKDAEELEIQILDASEKILGLGDPDTLTSMSSLSYIYMHQGRLNEAEELTDHISTARKRIFGPDHPLTQADIANFVSFSRQHSWSSQHEETKNLKIREAILGAEDPDILSGGDGKNSNFGCNDISSYSTGSLPQSSVFDKDNRSRGTYLSTVSPPQTRTKGETPHSAFDVAVLSRLDTPQPLGPGADQPEHTDLLHLEAESKSQNVREDFDAVTTCSIDSGSDDQKLRYIQVFVDQLSHDINSISGLLDVSNTPSSYLSYILKVFAWKLHGESINPFQWEASVILRQKQTKIIDLLSRTLETGEENWSNEDSVSEYEEDDDLSKRQAFKKPPDMLSEWINKIEPLAPKPEELERVINDSYVQDDFDQVSSQLPDYEKFIRQSDAYQWLLLKIHQHRQLALEDTNLISNIGSKIQNRLRAQGPLHRISRRRASLVRMTFNLDWNPMRYFRSQGSALPAPNILERVLCLTGSWSEAQATTGVEYIRQTWPITGEHTISFIRQLIALPEGEELTYQLPGPKSAQIRANIQSPSSCSISVTASLYFVSEIAEQIAWLAAALRESPSSDSVLTCLPRVEDLSISTNDGSTPGVVVIGSCRILFDLEKFAETYNPLDGFCWGPLFYGTILVSGYPVPRRSESDTGLEVSLAIMACLVRSQQIVQWDERIIMKGFSSLLVATLATANIVVWHLVANRDSSKRISYTDPRLDTLNARMPEEFSLRLLEGSRHIIGWCSSATDFCGHAKANQNISASGLRKSPSSIVIDRLYMEAGQYIVGGLDIGINKKDQPFWLEREHDYPSLLKWISLQPVVLYDASERRAWLVDGVSALLHLVRVSLYLDENDPESPYDWVFDSTKLKSNWDGCTGRLAALKTLRSWENFSLKLYIKHNKNRSGESEMQFATFGERVEKLLHSIEILMDRQAKVSSQDGIRISQTLNAHKGIVGFDIMDIVTPLGPIHTRIKHLDSWGSGWSDLIPSIGATTIFGNGFGDLICPNDPEAVCCRWRSVPTGMDYMATSVSTLKMLYEKRLLRIEPGLRMGEMTNKITWTSTFQPFKPCECLNGEITNVKHHLHPVQFLISKNSRRLGIVPKGLTPIDLTKLEEKGAVVFGHWSLLGWVKDSQTDEEKEQTSSTEETNSSQGELSPSTAGSVENQSTVSTSITQPSSQSSAEEVAIQHDTDPKGKRVRKEKKQNIFKKLMARRLNSSRD